MLTAQNFQSIAETQRQKYQLGYVHKFQDPAEINLLEEWKRLEPPSKDTDDGISSRRYKQVPFDTMHQSMSL